MDAQFDAFVRAYEDDETFPFRRYVEAPGFFKALGDIQGQSVLDAGCGAGLYTRRFKSRGATRVVGLDIAPNMIDYCRARESEEKQGLEYVLDDAANAGRLGPFDVVTAIYVLPYAQTWEQLRSMCQGLFDALRPGGRLVALPVNPDGFFTRKDYYERYGLSLFPAEGTYAEGERLPDGTPLRLLSRVLDVPLDVIAYYWGREAQEQALRDAGFRQIHWHQAEVSPEGIAASGAEHWRPYLERPHSVPFVAVK